MWQVVLYITSASVMTFVLAMLALSWVGAWWYQRNYDMTIRTARVLLAAWGFSFWWRRSPLLSHLGLRGTTFHGSRAKACGARGRWAIS